MSLQMIGLFCEDIREEASGQQTLIGVLPDNINLPAPPSEAAKSARPRIPKLGLYLRVQIGTEEDLSPLTIKLIFSNGSEVDLGTIDQNLIERSKSEAKENGLALAGIRFSAVLQGFQIQSFGAMSAVAEIAGERKLFGMLNFRVAD